MGFFNFLRSCLNVPLDVDEFRHQTPPSSQPTIAPGMQAASDASLPPEMKRAIEKVEEIQHAPQSLAEAVRKATHDVTNLAPRVDMTPWATLPPGFEPAKPIPQLDEHDWAVLLRKCDGIKKKFQDARERMSEAYMSVSAGRTKLAEAMVEYRDLVKTMTKIAARVGRLDMHDEEGGGNG